MKAYSVEERVERFLGNTMETRSSGGLEAFEDIDGARRWGQLRGTGAKDPGTLRNGRATRGRSRILPGLSCEGTGGGTRHAALAGGGGSSSGIGG